MILAALQATTRPGRERSRFKWGIKIVAMAAGVVLPRSCNYYL